MKTLSGLCLVVRRIIPASCSRLFEAWTNASQLQAWWGPEEVLCVHAESDARVGGRYRIDNELPNGNIIVITGEFRVVEAPHKLVYTWNARAIGAECQDFDSQNENSSELVTVRFVALGASTEVIVTHERIDDLKAKEEHGQGWIGCLDGLTRFFDTKY